MRERLTQLVRLRRPATGERGQALVLAILVMLVLVIGATAIAGLVASNETNSGRERQTAQALSAGEGGLDLAANAVNAGTASTVPTTTNIDQYGYSVGYWEVPVTDGSYPVGSYYLNSKTVSPTGKVTRVLQEVIVPRTVNGFTTTPVTVSSNVASTSTGMSTLFTTTTGQPSPFWSYGFVMGGAPHTGNLTPDQVCANPSTSLPTTSFGGSGAISVPVWIAGDVCITGGANPAIGNPVGSTIGVHIGGNLYVNGPDSAIGTPASPVADADIYICWTDFHSWYSLSCQSNAKTANDGGSGVYASSYGQIAQPVSPPSVTAADDQYWWQNATFGPNHTTCSTSGTMPAGIFDNNAGSTTGPDTSLGLKNFASLLGASKFDCVSGSSEFKWDPTTSPKTLYLRGTAFFDANLYSPGGGTDNQIQLAQNSNGTIHVDGYLQLTNDGAFCGYFDGGKHGGQCDPSNGSWNPGSHAADPLIEWDIFNRSNTQYGFDLEGDAKFEGVAIANGGFYLSNSAAFAGSVFATYGTVNGAGTFLTTGQVPIGGLGGAQTLTTPISTTTYYSTTTTPGGATITQVTESTWTASWNVAPGSWKQCPISGCPTGS